MSKIRRFISFILMIALAISVLTALPVSVSAVTSYYVDSTNGNDNNSGSFSTPFRTIQKAASVMAAGDTCYIRTGTYNETVIPTNSGSAGSPITFMPYNNETVTIEGADDVTGWTLYSGNIYKATVSAPAGLFANQVFVDGNMMTEARWPNAITHQLDRTDATADSGTTSTRIYDADLNGYSTDFFQNAKIWIGSGSSWFAQTGNVTSSASGYIDINTLPRTGYDYDPKAGNRYYLFGKLNMLDTISEWYYDGAALYLWTPNGDNPSSHTVKMKRRNYAFDLNGKSFITIKGVNIRACTITTNNSSNIVIDGIDAKYVSHYTTFNDGFEGHRVDSGIILNGSENIIRNSKIAYSAGNGIALVGYGNQVVNNEIHDIDYAGTYDNGISSRYITDFEGPNVLIKGNTIYNTGRDGMLTQMRHSSMVYNHIYNTGWLMRDTGGFYTGGKVTDAARDTVVAYNRVHDNKAAYLGVGIYLDTGSSNFLVHHNVVYNTFEGVHINDYGPLASDNRIYNNTIVSTGDNVIGMSDMTRCSFVNNIYRGNTAYGALTAETLNNLPSTTDPIFVNPGTYDFHLQSSSPAKDAGRSIPGITDGYSGTAPDIGAYEYGGADWSAGYTAPTAGAPESPGITGISASSATQVSLSWNSVSGATGYKIKYGKSSGIYTNTVDVGNVTSSNVTGLSEKTKYYFVVTAYNGSGESTQSYEKRIDTGYQVLDRIDAEDYSSQSGVANAGIYIQSLDDNDWVKFSNVNFNTPGTTSFLANLACDNVYAGNNIEIRLDSTGGTLLGTLRIAGTGGLSNFATQCVSVAGTSGVHDLYLVFKGGSNVAKLNWFKFVIPWSGTKADDTGASVSYYNGTWYNTTDYSPLYNSTQHYAFDTGAYAQFTFTGTSIRWIATRAYNRGITDVYIDNVFITKVDMYGPGEVCQTTMFEADALAFGSHTIKLVNTGTKNPSSSNYVIDVDAFEYGSVNLLSNPGFETDFAYWMDWGNTAIDTSNVHSGLKAVRNGTAGAGREQNIFSGVVPGVSYTINAWGKLGAAGEPNCKVVADFRNSSDANIGSRTITWTETTYTKKSDTFTTPAGTVKIKVYFWKDTGSSYFYIDDISLTRN